MIRRAAFRPLREMISRSLELRPAHDVRTVEDFYIEGLLSGPVHAVALSEELEDPDEFVLFPGLDKYARCIADSFTRRDYLTSASFFPSVNTVRRYGLDIAAKVETACPARFLRTSI